MAQKPEAKYKTKIHRYLDKSIYRQGMFTPFSGGTPDTWYSGKKDIWIEYKWDIKTPKTIDLCKKTVKYPKISRKQQRWLTGRSWEGRNVAVIYATPDGGHIFLHRTWEIPMSREIFISIALPPKKVAQWIEDFVNDKLDIKKVMPI